jgi:hypothetical protein
MEDKYFGTIGLEIGDKLYGPRDAVAVVSSGGGGTLVKVLQPRLSVPPGIPDDYDPHMVNYSLNFATKRILGIGANATLEKDVFEYWYFRGRRLSEY